jgi:hypothetical protein
MLFFSTVNAQESKAQKGPKPAKEHVSNLVEVDEYPDHTRVKFPGGKVEVHEHSDTITKITLGHKRFEVIEDHNKTRVRMVRVPRKKFKGHFAGFDIGFNGYMAPDYQLSLPPGSQFMDLNASKSVNVSLNFLQYSIPLQRYRNNIGLVMGLGWTFNNYRTDSQYILERDENGIIVGRPETERTVSKNKLATNFFNFPLLLEFQIPTNQDKHRFFISAGGYAGFLKKAHTKTVYNDNGSKSKDKYKGNLNVKPFQYGAMVRVGYRWIKLYGTYNFSTLLMEDKGPELYPYSIGLTLISF